MEEHDLIDKAILDLERVPGERRLPILAVGARQCRWPVADDPTVIGGILCCGAQTEATYCKAHRKLAYADRQRLGTRARPAQAARMLHVAVDGEKAIGSANRDIETDMRQSKAA